MPVLACLTLNLLRMLASVMRAGGRYGVNSGFYTRERYDRAKLFYAETKKISETLAPICWPTTDTLPERFIFLARKMAPRKNHEFLRGHCLHSN
jgi:hypothetical protein